MGMQHAACCMVCSACVQCAPPLSPCPLPFQGSCVSRLREGQGLPPPPGLRGWRLKELEEEPELLSQEGAKFQVHLKGRHAMRWCAAGRYKETQLEHKAYEGAVY